MTEGNARELRSPVRDSDPEQFKVSELLLVKHAYMIRCYLNMSGHVGCTDEEMKTIKEVFLKNVKSLKNPNSHVPK